MSTRNYFKTRDRTTEIKNKHLIMKYFLILIFGKPCIYIYILCAQWRGICRQFNNNNWISFFNNYHFADYVKLYENII